MAAALLAVTACDTVPVTGRSQLMLLPEGTEVEMGLTAYREVLSKGKVSADSTLNAQVTRVGRRIAEATGKNYQWEFRVLEDKQAHGGERVSQGLLVQTGLAATQVALARNDPRMVQSVTSLLGAGAAVGLLLPWSRAQESEADHLGLVYMAKAGYHPSAARDLWVRMAQAERSQGRPLEFLSTHPAPETRIRQIEGWIPEALQYYRPR